MTRTRPAPICPKDEEGVAVDDYDNDDDDGGDDGDSNDGGNDKNYRSPASSARPKDPPSRAAAVRIRETLSLESRYRERIRFGVAETQSTRQYNINKPVGSLKLVDSLNRTISFKNLLFQQAPTRNKRSFVFKSLRISI